MGEVIRKSAAAADIIADVRSALISARAKGGHWKSVAEERLAALTALIADVEQRLESTQRELAPLLAAVDAKDDEADRLLGRISDEIWNEVGRPANDPALSILFPGGIAYYANGDTAGQPDRMDLLAELLESGLHPRLSAERAKAHAQEVRSCAESFRTLIDGAARPNARLDMLTRVTRALASSGQAELANVKRLYKSHGFSEADIHTVIPDRPGVRAKKEPAAAQSPGSASSAQS